MYDIDYDIGRYHTPILDYPILTPISGYHVRQGSDIFSETFRPDQLSSACIPQAIIICDPDPSSSFNFQFKALQGNLSIQDCNSSCQKICSKLLSLKGKTVQQGCFFTEDSMDFMEHGARACLSLFSQVFAERNC